MEHRRWPPFPGASPDPEWTGLRIPVVAATGSGRTTLSAFDGALQRCGVHDYNLLALSSVIPPASQVVRCACYPAPWCEFGHRLYVVKAEMRSAEEGATIAAGLGWLQWSDAGGVFVEHEMQARGLSPAEVEAALERQIADSLSDLAQRRGVAFVAEQAHMRIVSTVVGALPACALVLAVYQARGWSDETASGERRRS